MQYSSYTGGTLKMCKELAFYNYAVRTSICAFLLISFLAVAVQVITVLDCLRLFQIVQRSVKWCYRYRPTAAYCCILSYIAIHCYILLYIAVYCCTLPYITIYCRTHALIG